MVVDMVTLRLRWVVSDPDRHGNSRWYLRRPGHKKIRLPGLPGTPEFMAAYNAAIAGDAAPAPLAATAGPGSVNWLCQQYFAGAMFLVEISKGTQNARRNILKQICATIGALPYARIEQRHIVKWMDARSATPEAANNLLKALRHLFLFAFSRGLMPKDAVNPTDGIRKIHTDTEGHHTWTVQEVRQYEARHPIGTTARLALALLLFTGQRRGDVVGMGTQHLEALDTGELALRIRRGKNKKTDKAWAFLPVLPELQQVIDGTPTTGLAFLITHQGKPYTSNGFGNAMRVWCDQAGLKHCTAHGLRKAGATIAADNGATDRQLMAIFGWAKADMATLYTRQADQKRLAAAGMGLLVPGTKPDLKKSHLVSGETKRAKS
jgi:integrase